MGPFLLCNPGWGGVSGLREGERGVDTLTMGHAGRQVFGADGGFYCGVWYYM